MIDAYWLHDKNAPYAALLTILSGHCHPETDEDAYDDLKDRARRTDDPETDAFKRELRAVIADPSVLPADALFTAAEYDDGSDERFLARLWRDLYPGEPFPGGE